MTRAGGCQQAPMSPARSAARGLSGVSAAVHTYTIDVGMLCEGMSQRTFVYVDEWLRLLYEYSVRPGRYWLFVPRQRDLPGCTGIYVPKFDRDKVVNRRACAKLRKELGRE